MLGAVGEMVETAADHSTLKGAKALARRLEAFWQERGHVARFEPYLVCVRSDGKGIYGVRPRSRRKMPFRPIAIPPGTLARLRTICEDVLHFEHPGVAWAHITNPDDRGLTVTAARQACIRAAVASRLCTSHYQLGKFFNTSHSSIMWAVRGTGLECVSKSEKRVRRSWLRDAIAA